MSQEDREQRGPAKRHRRAGAAQPGVQAAALARGVGVDGGQGRPGQQPANMGLPRDPLDHEAEHQVYPYHHRDPPDVAAQAAGQHKRGREQPKDRPGRPQGAGHSARVGEIRHPEVNQRRRVARHRRGGEQDGKTASANILLNEAANHPQGVHVERQMHHPAVQKSGCEQAPGLVRDQQRDHYQSRLEPAAGDLLGQEDGHAQGDGGHGHQRGAAGQRRSEGGPHRAA
jgi:hypothetical protein